MRPGGARDLMAGTASDPQTRRGGSRSRADWLAMRSAFEAGVDVDTLARRYGLRASTIHARRKAEDWIDLQDVLAGLSRSLAVGVRALDTVLNQTEHDDMGGAIRLLEIMVRAADRHVALLDRVKASVAEAVRDDDAAQTRDSVVEVRAELERRLARLAASASSQGVADAVDGT